MEKRFRVIAYYLPQFHPIAENDEWWGKGFTEWTNVGKAKPLFRGHYQPKVPSDLGYYDLRLSETREEQARLATEAGLEGFCYWHYWFGDGKQLLERPFKEVVSSGKPNLGFCLGWANESWQSKIWNTDGSRNKTLIEQVYPGKEDNVAHFYSLLDAFKDERYIRVNNKPIFLIYRPFGYAEVSEFISEWNELARLNGIENGFYFVAHANSFDDYEKLMAKGFESVTISPVTRIQHTYKSKPKLQRGILSFIRKIASRPLIIPYKKAYPFFVNDREDQLDNVIPSIIPNWDHSPRSGKNASLLHNPTPELFRKHIRKVLSLLKNKPIEKRIVFLKSWNEWAEGNYIEPDLKHGKAFLNVLKEEITNPKV